MNPDDVVANPTQPQPVDNRFSISCGTIGICCPYDNIRVNFDILSGLSGGIVKQLQKNEFRNKGEYTDYFQLNDLQAGKYYLRFYIEKTENVLPLTITTF